MCWVHKKKKEIKKLKKSFWIVNDIGKAIKWIKEYYYKLCLVSVNIKYLVETRKIIKAKI